jgi:hypothetical protein
MRLISSDIKKAVVLTFKDYITYEYGYSEFIPEEMAFFITGIVIEDEFLDINNMKFYPILFIDESGWIITTPEIEKQYVYAAGTYPFKSKEEETKLLKKAYEALDLLKIKTEKNNIVSFQKYKDNKYRKKL